MTLDEAKRVAHVFNAEFGENWNNAHTANIVDGLKKAFPEFDWYIHDKLGEPEKDIIYVRQFTK